jgi:hypothetical protein
VFSIQLDDYLSAEYTIYNIAGVKIQSGLVDLEQKIELKEKIPGVYVLELNTFQERKVVRLVVK